MQILNDFLNLDKCRAPKRDAALRRIREAQEGQSSPHDYGRHQGVKIDARSALVRHAEVWAEKQGRVVPFNFAPQSRKRADRRAA